MTTKDKISKLSAQIKEKEDESSALLAEAYKLRGEREQLVAQLIQDERLLSDTNWELRLDGGSKLYLELREPPGGKMDAIASLSNTDYHSWFDLEDGIRLQFDDSDVSFSFEDSKQLMPFVKKNKMKVTGAGILDRLSKLKREASTLEEVCHTFGITKWMFYLATHDMNRVSDQEKKEFKHWKAWELEELPSHPTKMDAYISSKLQELTDKKLMWFVVMKYVSQNIGSNETIWYILESNGNQHPAITAGKAYP